MAWGNFSKRAGSFVSGNAGRIVLLTLIATALLALPIFLMAPEKRAKSNPGGEVFDLSDTIQDRMPEANMYSGFIAEARDGNMLNGEELLELFLNEEELRSSSLGGKYLVNRYDVELDRWSVGIYTIADAVNDLLISHFSTDLADATEDQVCLAVHMVLTSPEGGGFRDTFS